MNAMGRTTTPRFTVNHEDFVGWATFVSLDPKEEGAKCDNEDRND